MSEPTKVDELVKEMQADYLTKLLLRAAKPETSRERQRQILWKALRMLDVDTTSTWWTLKMNLKMWIHEKICGTKWCE